MPVSKRHHLLAGDISEALRVSRKSFGVRQAERYADAIEDAIEHVAAYPEDGRRYRLRRGFWLFHIRRPKRRARHQLLYFVDDDGSVFLLRLLHDRMSVKRHIPEE